MNDERQRRGLMHQQRLWIVRQSVRLPVGQQTQAADRQATEGGPAAPSTAPSASGTRTRDSNTILPPPAPKRQNVGREDSSENYTPRTINRLDPRAHLVPAEACRMPALGDTGTEGGGDEHEESKNPENVSYESSEEQAEASVDDASEHDESGISSPSKYSPSDESSNNSDS
ncbi:hypothetical protein DVH05_027334 [Phytophthora capsici]|nr:hypothetical protein DVH05_027334 [Phytophthora capsici]